MSEAAQRETWQHTAFIACMIANANRDPKKKPRPFAPDDFNPTLTAAEKRQRRRAHSRVITNMGDLKDAFMSMKR